MPTEAELRDLPLRHGRTLPHTDTGAMRTHDIRCCKTGTPRAERTRSLGASVNNIGCSVFLGIDDHGAEVWALLVDIVAESPAGGVLGDKPHRALVFLDVVEDLRNYGVGIMETGAMKSFEELTHKVHWLQELDLVDMYRLVYDVLVDELRAYVAYRIEHNPFQHGDDDEE
jgi:hypothetical protein